jgi:hypothetical protein
MAQEVLDKKPPATVTTYSEPDLVDEIRHRAYELYAERGCKDGHAMDDWLRAEEELFEEAAKSEVAGKVAA